MFTENLDLFFDQNEHAVAATIKTSAGVLVRNISVIFNALEQDTAIFDASVEGNLPFVLCKKSDLSGIGHTHTMTIGSVQYRVERIVDDGTGVAQVQLSA
ncbi:MAG: hypothetical protein M3362_15575 [Acidobacteriota bacterium]|nr:hypothetical protein [Acidobacteriota bacterium]